MRLKSVRTALALVLITTLSVSMVVIFPLFSQGGPNGPRMNILHIKNYGNPDAEFAALESGEIDIVDWPVSKFWIDRWVLGPDGVPVTGDELVYNGLPGTDQIRLSRYSELAVYDYDIYNQRWPTGVGDRPEDVLTYDPLSGTEKAYFGDNQPWDDKAWHFRLAIRYLTDIDYIQTWILQGYGLMMDTQLPQLQEGWLDFANLSASSFYAPIPHPTKGPILIPSLIYPTTQDIQMAKDLLDAAGFVVGPDGVTRVDPRKEPGDPGYPYLDPLIFYIRLDDPHRRAAGEKLADDLRSIGIPVDDRVVEKTVCFKSVMIEYNYHLYTGGYSIDAEPIHLYNWHSSQYWGPNIGESRNYIGFCNREYDPHAYDVMFGSTYNDVLWGVHNSTYILNKYMPKVPLWSHAGVHAYRTGWEDTVNMKGEGKDNRWSFLNMYNPSPTHPDTIWYGFKSNPEALHPVSSQGIWDWKILDQIYDPLLARNPYDLGKRTGWLAVHEPGLDGRFETGDDIRGWETGMWDTDKIYVNITLRQNTYFHDGTQITPDDIRWNIDFIKACGPGVAWNYMGYMDVDHVDTWDNTAAGGGWGVVVYFKTGTYWALNFAGWTNPILNPKVWMAANAAYGWNYDPATGTFTPEDNRFLVRTYHVWEDNVYNPADGIVDMAEDGSGPWIFVGADLWGWVDLKANRNYHRTQTDISDYLHEAFHRIGNVNYPGSYFEAEYIATGLGIDEIISDIDIDLINRAMWTNRWDDPWGINPGEYNPDADLDNSGSITTWDGVIAGRGYGRTADGVRAPFPYSPKADFTPLTSETFYVSEPVPFNATASMPGFDGDDSCPIVEYRWDFGDTTTETTIEPTTTHQYTMPGDYDVTLTVYAPGTGYIDPWYFEYDSEVHTIHIVPPPYPPTADFWPPTSTTFYVSELVLFDANASTPGWDGDDICPIVEYRWDFGDATPPVTTTVPLATHHYTTLGDYSVNLTVYAPGIGPFIDPDYDPYDSEVHTIHIVSKLEPRKLIDIVEFPGTVILEDMPVDETLMAKFVSMEGFNETKNLLTAKGYNFTATLATASRVTGGLNENTFSGIVLSWWSDVGPKGTRALIAAAIMDDNTTMVFGVITNLLPPELTTEGQYIIVNAMPYVSVEWYWWAWSPLGKIVRWSYWWYDSHSHPNWYWGCYWWWRTYIRNYLPPTGLPGWMPWWWWFWHWTYWKHWYWWSTGFPYDP